MNLCFLLHRILKILPPYVSLFKNHSNYYCLVSVSVREKKKLAVILHDLEQLYKHPSFDYTWSYKKKKKKRKEIESGHISGGYMLGFLLSKTALKKKKKKA